MILNITGHKNDLDLNRHLSDHTNGPKGRDHFMVGSEIKLKDPGRKPQAAELSKADRKSDFNPCKLNNAHPVRPNVEVFHQAYRADSIQPVTLIE